MSTPRKIYIADRRTDKIAKISGKKQLEFDTKLSTPAIGESIVSNKDATPVRFSWRLFFPSDERLVLVVRSGKQTVLRKPVGRRLSTVHALPAGTYTWKLVWEIRRGANGRNFDEAASEINSFSVAPNSSKNLVSAVETLLQNGNKNGNKTVLFVDQW